MPDAPKRRIALAGAMAALTGIAAVESVRRGLPVKVKSLLQERGAGARSAKAETGFVCDRAPSY
jgi:hypothetical protein